MLKPASILTMLNAKILDTRKARLCKTLDLYRIVEYITYITFSQIDTLEILALKYLQILNKM